MYKKSLQIIVYSLSFLLFTPQQIVLARPKKSPTSTKKSISVALEQGCAAARLFISIIQSSTQECVNVAPQAQARINIAASTIRVANFLTQWSNHKELDLQFIMPSLAWAVYDSAQLGFNIASLADSSEMKQTATNENVRKCRIFASFIEGGTALALSLNVNTKDNKALCSRLQTACSLARSIDVALMTEDDDEKTAMIVIVLAHVAHFVYTCLKDFDSTPSTATTTTSSSTSPSSSTTQESDADKNPQTRYSWDTQQIENSLSTIKRDRTRYIEALEEGNTIAAACILNRIERTSSKDHNHYMAHLFTEEKETLVKENEAMFAHIKSDSELQKQQDKVDGIRKEERKNATKKERESRPEYQAQAAYDALIKAQADAVEKNKLAEEAQATFNKKRRPTKQDQKVLDEAQTAAYLANDLVSTTESKLKNLKQQANGSRTYAW